MRFPHVGLKVGSWRRGGGRRDGGGGWIFGTGVLAAQARLSGDVPTSPAACHHSLQGSNPTGTRAARCLVKYNCCVRGCFWAKLAPAQSTEDSRWLSPAWVGLVQATRGLIGARSLPKGEFAVSAGGF